VKRLLAVSDEESELAYSGYFSQLEPDLIVACGDLTSDYLEYLVTVLNKPLLYVPGNHDPATQRGPEGCVNVDMRIEEVSGLRVAGLGGSHRYRPGPNQYTQEQMRSRVRRLVKKSRIRGVGPRIDVTLTHSPPAGVGDDDDACHRGFEAFHELISQTSPKLFVHGHIHPYGRKNVDHMVGSTQVVNAVGYRLVEVAP
jgi:Icc-related predicted phosphoesterase